MRCPSTSDLVHMQANHAYDKLAVISDNIEALQAIYDFIFDIKEYLHQRLQDYMHKHKDELIDGQKTFTKPIRLEELELFSSVNADIEDTVGNIKLNFTTCAPYISFKVSRTDDETHEEYISEVKLILDTCNGEPLLTIPPTNGEVDESSVRVDYLNEQLLAIKNRLLSLEDRATQLESDVSGLGNRISPIETKMNNILDYPVDGSSELVTSNGIYDYGQAILNTITDAMGNIQDNNTTYSFALNGTNLVVTPNVGNQQSVDLSSLVSSGSGNSGYAGNEETEGNYIGWRFWNNGKFAAIHVPAEISTDMYNQQAATLTLPLDVASVIYINKTLSASQSSDGIGIEMFDIQISGTTLTVVYTSGTGNSPGQAKNPALDILCWLN